EPPPLRSGENTERLQYSAEIAKCNNIAIAHGRSRAAASTKWGEYEKIAIFRGDCKKIVILLHCYPESACSVLATNID
ncbi:MAG: hypothetical protein RSF00_02575, partial [Oscillospiraceae bacterium]